MKIGIVGTNFISDWFCEAARSVEGVTVTAIYSRKLDTAHAFGEKWGIKNCFCDYAEMLGCDIDAVYIASPTFMHEAHSVMAMEHGKSVLCEKMLACSYSGALRMVKCANQNDVLLLEAMRPFLGDEKRAKLDTVIKLLGLAEAAGGLCSVRH